MKKLITHSAIVLLFFVTIGSLKAQTIYVCNNNPGATGGTNVFTGNGAIVNAIAAATAGDILHVIPSTIPYTDFSIDRSLSIYGIGTNPPKEGTKTSKVGTIYIGANNVVISGMQFNYLYLGTTSNQSWNGILVENCNIAYIIANNVYSNVIIGNMTIRSNVFNGISGSDRIYFNFDQTSNISITNNIIVVENSTSYQGINVNGGAVITNNLFVSDGGINAYAFQSIDGCVIKNNVFLGVQPRGYTATTNNTFTNNATWGSPNDSIPVGTNDTNNDWSNVDPVLVNVPLNTQWDFGYDPRPDTVASASPLPFSGDDGTDIGLTGGAIPFNFEGTNLPLIQSVSIPSVIIQGNTLPTTIKAKGN